MIVHKTDLRQHIFLHLDGLVTAPTAYYLWQSGVLQELLDQTTVDLQELTQKFNANEGYLNVALRVLASQGFFDYHLDTVKEAISISLNANSKEARITSYNVCYTKLLRL